MPSRPARRIACLLIAGFAAAVERARHPEIGAPLLVHEGGRVLGACSQAREQGVREGDPLQGARARCPGALLLPADRPAYEVVWGKLLLAAADHTPAVEAVAPGLAYLDATGLVPLYPSETAWGEAVLSAVQRAVGVSAGLGIARTKCVAQLAAADAQPGQGPLLVQGDRAFLAPRPLADLPLDDETLRRCALLGLRTVGRFAALPRPAVAEQFGPEALTAHDWARGCDPRPVQSRLCASLSRRHSFAVPAQDAIALHAILAELGAALLQNLSRRGLAVRWARLRVRYERGGSESVAAWLGNGAGQPKLERALRWLVDGLQGPAGATGWGAGVSELSLALTGLEPLAGVQLDLFAHRADRLRLEGTLRRLAQRHAPATVLRPQVAVVDTPLLSRRYALRALEAEP